MRMTKEELAAADVLIDLALHEDIGTGDITTENLVPENLRNNAIMVAKSEGVLAGLEVAEKVFHKLDEYLEWKPIKNDGDSIVNGDIIVAFSANYRALLSGERTALNFLQRMSGIATISRICAGIIKDYKTKILDTRKTLPGFRLLDKYSVRAGGGVNHRIGLFDMVMIKDNHIRVAGGITNAVNDIRAKVGSDLKIEVETTNLTEVAEALAVKADIIMLDNMDNTTMQKAVSIIGNKAKTEASGNMTLERLMEVAKTGVDFISVGALTHSVMAFDISQEIL
jgi:nicotinate-nucleotide pyrophosphorylase (carboxylating)